MKSDIKLVKNPNLRLPNYARSYDMPSNVKFKWSTASLRHGFDNDVTSQYKDCVTGSGIFIIEIRLPWDRLIFIIRMLVLVRWHLHIKTPPPPPPPPPGTLEMIWNSNTCSFLLKIIQPLTGQYGLWGCWIFPFMISIWHGNAWIAPHKC